MGDSLIYITEGGMHYLNISQKRRVIVEKKRKLNRADEIFLKLDEEMLEILDKISHGDKVFSAYYSEIPHWRYGRNALDAMLRRGLVKEEMWSPPPVYTITYA